MIKIAIQGHPTRGKEVTKILESFGGKDVANHSYIHSDLWYYLDSDNFIICSTIIPSEYKKYTLEEFEKEFPFKIGDKVIHKEFNDFFEVISFDPESSYPYKIKGVCEFNTKSYVLTKWYPKMKEERFVTLTLDKAKEWYKKSGELREIALQAFTEKELNPLPRSWEEFCKRGNPIASWRYAIPTKYEALYKLEQLRNCWWNGWEPIWDASTKYAIKRNHNEIHVIHTYSVSAFLVFPTREMAEEFLECFRDLIEKAGGLI